MLEFLRPWLHMRLDRRAVTALEYALIAGVIIAIIVTGFRLMGNSASSKFVNIGGSL